MTLIAPAAGPVPVPAAKPSRASPAPGGEADAFAALLGREEPGASSAGGEPEAPPEEVADELADDATGCAAGTMPDLVRIEARDGFQALPAGAGWGVTDGEDDAGLPRRNPLSAASAMNEAPGEGGAQEARSGAAAVPVQGMAVNDGTAAAGFPQQGAAPMDADAPAPAATLAAALPGRGGGAASPVDAVEHPAAAVAPAGDGGGVARPPVPPGRAEAVFHGVRVGLAEAGDRATVHSRAASASARPDGGGPPAAGQQSAPISRETAAVLRSEPAAGDVAAGTGSGKLPPASAVQRHHGADAAAPGGTSVGEVQRPPAAEAMPAAALRSDAAFRDAVSRAPEWTEAVAPADLRVQGAEAAAVRGTGPGGLPLAAVPAGAVPVEALHGDAAIRDAVARAPEQKQSGAAVPATAGRWPVHDGTLRLPVEATRAPAPGPAMAASAPERGAVPGEGVVEPPPASQPGAAWEASFGLPEALGRPEAAPFAVASDPVPRFAPEAQAADAARQVVRALIDYRGAEARVVLDPEELGTVRLTVSVQNGGTLIQIVADRPETAELMRRHADLLLQDLTESGVGLARLSFASGGDAGGRDGGRPGAPAPETRPGATARDVPPHTTPERAAGAARGLDMRV